MELPELHSRSALMSLRLQQPHNIQLLPLFIRTNNTSAAYTNSLVYMIGDDQNLVLSSSNGNAASFGNSTARFWTDTGITVGNANNETLTVIQDAATSTISFYLNGSLVSSVDNWNCAAMTGAQFGATFGGGNKIGDVNIDNLAIWDRALTSAEVATLTGASVPEPYTATLSLLALGALALRRRRA